MKVKRKNKIRIEDLLKRTDAVSASRVIATCHLDGNDAQTRTTSVSEYERDVAVHARHGRDAVNCDAAADKTDDVLPSASNDVESGRESDPRSHHVEQSDAHLTQRETNDLRVPEVWAAYYKRLSEIGQRIQDEKGWRHFDAVFMVSAVDGDGVDDLKVSDNLELTNTCISSVAGVAPECDELFLAQTVPCMCYEHDVESH